MAWILAIACALAQTPADDASSEEDVLEDIELRPAETAPPVANGPLSLTGQLGLAVAPRGSTPGPYVHVDAAYRVPGVSVLDAVVGLSLLETRFRDAVADARTPDGAVAYRLSQQMTLLTAGVRLHAPYDPRSLRPELVVAVGAAIHRSATTVSAAEGSNRATETTLGPAVHTAARLSGTLSGPIQLVGGLGLDMLPTTGELTGRTLLVELHASLGLRVTP